MCCRGSRGGGEVGGGEVGGGGRYGDKVIDGHSPHSFLCRPAANTRLAAGLQDWAPPGVEVLPHHDKKVAAADDKRHHK
eukprot:COSAG04_NODE_8963_length_912_cov_1.002460_2_plen_78_part_01